MSFRFASRPRPFLATVAVVLALTASTRAGLLAPGQTGSGEAFVLDLNDSSFQGDTVASTSTPFECTGVNSADQPVFFRGTFNHKVARESATGQLAFHYQFLRGESNQILDFENFVVGDFGGFMTDVFSDQTSLSQAEASRSANGQTIGFAGDEEGAANLVVRTNATAFAEGGSASLFGSFQPSGGDSRQTFAAFTPIPLPPAVWAALSTMGAFGAIHRLRRRPA